MAINPDWAFWNRWKRATALGAGKVHPTTSSRILVSIVFQQFGESPFKVNSNGPNFVHKCTVSTRLSLTDVAPRYLAALALYSKSMTVAEATLALVNAGFRNEAFGPTRTFIDLFFTLRYIAIKDIEERAQRYSLCAFKNVEASSEVVRTYWPPMARPLNARTKDTSPRNIVLRTSGQASM